MQVHEPRRELHRFLVRLRFDDRVAADDFLRLGERAVDHCDLAPGEPHALALGGRLQPGGVDHRAALQRLADELAHRGEQGLRNFFVPVVLGVLDEHHVSHG